MKSAYTLILLALVPCISRAQDRGIVQCTAQQQSIPAWTEPRANGFVVENLACGQMVSITGLERGFVRIQFGEKYGFVDARFIRVQDQADQSRRIADLEAQVKALQQTPPPAPTAPPTPPHASAAPSASGTSTATRSPSPNAAPPAQHSCDTPSATARAVVFGGYNYVHLDGGAGWMDGWNAAVAGNLNSFFGIKAEGSGLYAKDKLVNDVRYSAYSFMAGPELTARGRTADVFGHALFGVTHLGGSAPFGGIRYGASLNAFSMAFGGGVDWHRDNWGVRIIQVDYLPWRALGAFAHNVRISSGVVLRFH
jgi:hypothetical protein